MRPTFTVLIGSKGRPSLTATLDSIKRQARIPGDQVYVVFDTRRLPFADWNARCEAVEAYNEPTRDPYQFLGAGHLGIAATEKVIPAVYSPTRTDLRVPAGAPYSWLGVEQINHALRTLPITGSHVLTIGDDDIFVPGAYDVLREVCAIDQSRPVLYRFVPPPGGKLWDRPRLRKCLISGCCIAAPRQFVGLHPTDIETTHDYRWIVDIVNAARAAGKRPIWLDYLAVIARPTPEVVAATREQSPALIVDEVEQEP